MKNNNLDNIIEGLIDKQVDGKKSKIPAKLDFYQSLTGLILAIFIKFHLIFVSSILISKDFMYSVDKILSGSLIVDGGHPGFIVGSAIVIFIILFVHALLAIRKFPNSYRQYRNFRSHTQMYPHGDTKLWAVQITTGFLLFFFASFHLYQMVSEPSNIGPYLSSDRIWTDGAWMMYIVLLIAVELHATIGLYRLAIKWGWFDGKTYKATREKLKFIRNSIIVFYIVLGTLSLGAYMKIGYEHQDNYGQKYIPTHKVEGK
ncbi:MAG: fumarate reductase cytochrome b subunit [Campylobacterota bacterium]|nr:fumarate reductase cytochrome b subunit [Campylobacterota bacterium]